VRIASYNVENLFERPVAMSNEDWEEGAPVLEWFAKLNELLENEHYSDDDKAAIVDLLEKLEIDKKDDGGPWAILRQNRGKLLRRPRDDGVEIVADGRTEWIGWVELKKQPQPEEAIKSTARVLKDVGAQVQGIVEAESRVALKDFSSVLLPSVGGQPFEHVMLIDGNDTRGIDVGLMTRDGYEIAAIRSHVDDPNAKHPVFSRDCPEYTVVTPAGNRLVVLMNHFKSKIGGGDAKRLKQATRVKEIYDELRGRGETNIAVLGDFNDHPQSPALQPLLAGNGLRDISEHPSFTNDGFPGTFDKAREKDKFDYVLLSPELFDRVQGGAVFRKGSWGGDGTQWEHYPEVTGKLMQASDHAAIYADLDL